VWRQILENEGLQASHLFSLEDKLPRCKEYVEEKVFAIDFDEKAVRVARTLNLIAGDGQTNVLHLNTLDYELWDEVTEQEEWDNIYHEGFRRLKKLRPRGSKDYREFQFDVLMANPPFAGDIKEPRMIARYDLAKKPDGKWQTKVGRDILFIERNLDFLKQGGRMAIVLPQGRFNNSSDKNLRDFIAERCRILAVVGLHGNTFKPHTGTKTSVLFVQKWNDDPNAGALCPRKDDYNIFFATMRKSGKDNAGDKIWRKISSSTAALLDDELSDLMPPSPVQRAVGVESDFLQDEHGHLVVDHDLYNHERLTEDGIAEAFIEFAKKEKLSFFEPSSSVTPFDAARYQRLMDGLGVAEISMDELKIDSNFLRIDAEFYQKHYLRIAELLKLKGSTDIRAINAKLDCSAFYPAITQYYRHQAFEDVPFLRVDEIQAGLIQITDNTVFLPEEVLDENQSTICRASGGDIVIAKGGDTLAKIGLIPEEFLSYAVCRDVIVLRTNEILNYNKYFLWAFLYSQYGYNLMLRTASQTGQPHLTLDAIYGIALPIASHQFQQKFEVLYHLNKQLKDDSADVYQQAEDLLLAELGLQDWQPTEETVAVKSFAESFLSSGRFDAEYYQPKFDQLIERLEEKVELTFLGDLLILNQRGKQPQYIEDEDEYKLGLPVVNSKHVREGKVILIDNRYAYPPETDDPLIIQTDDVLINGTGVGTIGRCAPYFYEQEALPDNHVTILRTDLLDPVYLSIYLNSIIGKLLVEKHFKGSSGQIELYPNEIVQFLVWEAPDSVQQEIRNKVENSHQKREQSKQLLEIAKTGVERAIEQTEEEAIGWINRQLKAIKIERLDSFT